MPLKPCLDGCGALTPTTRCPACTRTHDQQRRPSPQARGYTAAWNTAVRIAKAREPWCHNPDCPYDDAGSEANPLTGDHPVALSDGGSPSQFPVILCRRCNAAKGGANRTKPHF